MNTIIKDYLLNPLEPVGLTKARFAVINILIFVVLSLPSFLITQSAKNLSISGFSLWGAWVYLLIISIMHLLFIDWRMSQRFVLLVVYAQNRAVLVMVLAAIIYFPFEASFLMRHDNYLQEGLKQGTLFLKIITYGYFYYLFLQLIWLFNIKRAKA